MSTINLCNSKMHSGSKDLGLLFLRLAVGVPFLMHGISKVTNMDSTITFFEMIGLNSFFAYLVTILEIVAGIMITFGIFASIGAIITALVMLGAYIVVKNQTSFLGGYELDMILFFTSMAIFILGAGKYSITKSCICLDNKCCTNNCSSTCDKDCNANCNKNNDNKVENQTPNNNI